jgi:hypothetical protein
MEKFLDVSRSKMQDFYSPHLCDLVWGTAGILSKADTPVSEGWLAAFMEESGYQLEEFPADFEGFDLIKLLNGMAGHGVNLQTHPKWLDSFLKSAYLKSSSYVETACINQGLDRLKAGNTPIGCNCGIASVMLTCTLIRMRCKHLFACMPTGVVPNAVD